MFGKLSIRNVRRSAKDYMVYFLTMTFVTALMFAFNTVLFTGEMWERFDMAGVMAAMIGVATFFIILIVAWIINYMVRFMLEKRSREFGIYLLVGMKKKEVSRLYMQENILLGTGAFLGGIAVGMLIQQILLSILYNMIQVDYSMRPQFDVNCLLLTIGCYAGCYLLALLRCRKKFKKMNIYDLMNSQKQNEEVKEAHEEIKRWLLPVAIVFLLVFAAWLFFGKDWNTGTILFFLIGLVLVIYLFYTGVASFIICYVRKQGNAVYRGENLFLLRQFSSKIKTMRFTMGTLTALFTLALMGCSVALMLSDYQNGLMLDKWPFDIQVYSENAADHFEKELEVIQRETAVNESLVYRIYHNGTNEINRYLYTHLREFGREFKNSDGTPNEKAIREAAGKNYCAYDTYMRLSDYNALREMIGERPVQLESGQYLIHIKKRVFLQTGKFAEELHLSVQGRELKCAGYDTKGFSQDGHNGGDYVIVVPDETAAFMQPYYSELAVDIEGAAPVDLTGHLDALVRMEDYEEAEDAWMDDWDDDGEEEGNNCYGSDMIGVYNVKNLVRDNAIPEMNYVFSAVSFPMIYMGLVFLCVALTVLSVQQLSDSAKFKFRYGVLSKLGLGKREIRGIIGRQLLAYYMCPVLLAALISGVFSVYVGANFNFYTGILRSSFRYFGISFVLFFGIYAIYFTATYIGFTRNIEGDSL